MPRFFSTTAITQADITQTLTLTDSIYHHWCKVLRARVGDTATLFDGRGGEYTVTLTEINKKSALVSIDSYDSIERTPPYHVTLGLVMSRGERMDYAIQKACEMGVGTVQLLTSERCQAHLRYERDFKKIEHWQGVAIAACEQCGMNRVPQILPPLPLDEWVTACDDALKLVLALADGAPAFSKPLPATIALLIGSEGGLSPDEINLAIKHGYQPWTIGERVLRTETAPVVALTALHMLSI